MGIREQLDKYRGVMIGVVVLAVVGAVAEAFYVLKGPSVPAVDMSQITGPLVFYTADEGATLFTGYDKQNNPVDPNSGKPAVKAYVYWCGGKQVVGCLEKNSNGPGSSLMVKKPGVGDWIPDSGAAAAAIRLPKCPGGDTPTPVRASD